MLKVNFKTNELCKGNLLVLIITLYFEEKNTHQNLFIGLVRNGLNFFLLSIYLYKK